MKNLKGMEVSIRNLTRMGRILFEAYLNESHVKNLQGLEGLLLKKDQVRELLFRVH